MADIITVPQDTRRVLYTGEEARQFVKRSLESLRLRPEWRTVFVDWPPFLLQDIGLEEIVTWLIKRTKDDFGAQRLTFQYEDGALGGAVDLSVAACRQGFPEQPMVVELEMFARTRKRLPLSEEDEKLAKELAKESELVGGMPQYREHIFTDTLAAISFELTRLGADVEVRPKCTQLLVLDYFVEKIEQSGKLRGVDPWAYPTLADAVGGPTTQKNGGRWPRGSKPTAERNKKIYDRHNEEKGESVGKLAKEYGRSERRIKQIVQDERKRRQGGARIS